MIPIFRPWFGEEEVQAVREVLLSGWVGPGPKVEELESAFADYVGVRFAVSVNSCSSALFLALKVLGVEGGEVISTSMTFVATNHAILQNGATPAFCDIEPDTLNVDPACVAEAISERTSAVVVMHFAGHPCDMDPILEAAGSRGIPVVEDAAHATGTRYKDRMVGALGTIGCFSFHAVKNLSTCDGGMLTTDDPDLAERLRLLRWMGISKDTWERFGKSEVGRSWDYEVDEAGYKCQMNDLNAAIGLVQLGKLESANAQRREVVAEYGRAFADLPWLKRPTVKDYARSAHHAYVAQVADRDGLIDHLARNGVTAGVHYKPNHLYSVYSPYRRPLPVTESVWRNLITLPLYPSMTDADVAQVISAVRGFRPNGSPSVG
ncbi:MAG: DegT/DnrJ/EryC1/StrS family aminotransferase [Candidatus Latescibacteria bacterium]|jgi:perosamine synthetase|nr:DegT/DnrJ/EryC1/StrS family aminotransferase [Candidatus Latescibacterota bacterium]